MAKSVSAKDPGTGNPGSGTRKPAPQPTRKTTGLSGAKTSDQKFNRF